MDKLNNNGRKNVNNNARLSKKVSLKCQGTHHDLYQKK